MRLQDADLMTAIITPFTEDDKIDFNTLEELTNDLIEQGSNGFVIGGTTGETPTLTHDEKIELYTRFSQIVDGRAVIIAGTGSNNTKETIAFTNEVAAIPGIDYALVVVPPYNKPNQRSMVAHFTAVAGSVNLPVVIYNIPGRTGVKMDVSTILQLAQHPNIAGIKQCASIEEIEQLVTEAPSDFAVFTGEDAQALSARVLGAAGVISVATHLYCRQMRQMYDDLYAGDYAAAGAMQRWLTPKMNALFMYPSPSPVKAVLNAQGYQVGGCRLPLVPLNDEEKENLALNLGLASDALLGPLARKLA